MRVADALDRGVQVLGGFEYPKLEGEVLLACVLGQGRAFLKAHPEYRVSLFQNLRYRYWLYRRRQGIPVAYLLGYKDWGGMRLRVNRQVLIPRDETEVLCQHIQEQGRLPKSILDIGTGSGAVALALGRAFGGAVVVGVDVSEKALRVAQKNAEQNKVRVEFLRSDLLEVFPERSHWDLMVANLPYVPEGMKVSREVLQEPHLALFSGRDGLDLIRKLKVQIQEKRISFGALWLEFLPQQQEEMSKIFASWKVEFFGDSAGSVRFARVTSLGVGRIPAQR